MRKFTRVNFTMDSLPGKVYPGYTDGDDWNGWACPYFERPQAEAVLRASEPNGFLWRYDADGDAYVVRYNQAEDAAPEVFEGIDIEVDGVLARVYPIGAYSWIWELSGVE